MSILSEVWLLNFFRIWQGKTLAWPSLPRFIVLNMFGHVWSNSCTSCTTYVRLKLSAMNMDDELWAYVFTCLQGCKNQCGFHLYIVVGLCGPLCVIAKPFKRRLPVYLLACQIAWRSNVCVMSSAQMITFSQQSQLQSEVIGFQYQDETVLIRPGKPTCVAGSGLEHVYQMKGILIFFQQNSQPEDAKNGKNVFPDNLDRPCSLCT